MVQGLEQDCDVYDLHVATPRVVVVFLPIILHIEGSTSDE